MKYLANIFFVLFFISCNLSPGYDETDSDRKEVKLTPQVYIQQLNENLKETSALIQFDDKLWTLNDGGGKNEIYAVNDQGEIVLTVELSGVLNNDWEALTQDENYIYVGDFGNNKGSRTDLAVYKIMKSELSAQGSDLMASPEKIEFSYAAQDDFTVREYTHEFDCAAMFSSGNYLYLFSKDWSSFKTTVYKLPKEPGIYSLTEENSYNVGGLISGADISSDGNYFALLGYQLAGYNFVIPFIYLFESGGDDFFSKKSVYINLIAIAGAQTEGIVFLNDHQLVFTTELTDSYLQQAFTIDIADYLTHFD
ncbi:hypothetical protein ACUNWD_03920 [Sunxiuqinia sp. A32]|uniref:hypothetical protein n=1 Tax=Sunxiuqinia sp. A32 TaxID=3461496 RepID=UPI004046797F